ncbi:hypothetical protein N9R04_10390 [Staphylococcus sp. SQ8-PEA]|uniref:Transposase n=1 Tax=Staphylococcus marylandisciuri TaxID=2981529 RepID=A0ABT2QSX4_9STAP|nr:hypothetical protein [Staphylococcus marylandisciuri]MCU5747070.1 hypothetical protein [Staphylococcus marylandisciuri]
MVLKKHTMLNEAFKVIINNKSETRSGQKRLGFEQNQTMCKIVFLFCGMMSVFVDNPAFDTPFIGFPEHSHFMSQSL